MPKPMDSISAMSSDSASARKIPRLHHLGDEDPPVPLELRSAQDAPAREVRLAERPSHGHKFNGEGDATARESGQQPQEEQRDRPSWAGAPRQGWQSQPMPRSRRRTMAPPQVRLALVSDTMELLMAPGDVLCVKSSGRLMEIGAAGGFMGHVMVVVGPPRSIPRHSPEAASYGSAWPADAGEIWLVRTIESTRSQQGLWEVDLMLFVQRDSGTLMVFGEMTLEGEINLMEENERVELWQSPGVLREKLRVDLMMEVIVDIKSHLANWSAATAARAFVSQSSRTLRGPSAKVLDDMQACWMKDPICTSVVVIFWQRYLWKLADAANALRRQEDWIDAADMILKFMPLKADRVLPGQLLNTMQDVGFVALSRMPKVFQPQVVPTALPRPPAPQSPPSSDDGKADGHFKSGERVVYWSDSMGQWIDGIVLGPHFDSNGIVIAYDLDVRPFADVAKIRQAPQLPGGEQLPPAADRVCLPVSSRPRLLSGASREAMPPHSQNVASLSALITAALDEGWFSADDVERAVRASRAKHAESVSSKGYTSI